MTIAGCYKGESVWRLLRVYCQRARCFASDEYVGGDLRQSREAARDAGWHLTKDGWVCPKHDEEVER